MADDVSGKIELELSYVDKGRIPTPPGAGGRPPRKFEELTTHAQRQQIQNWKAIAKEEQQSLDYQRLASKLKKEEAAATIPLTEMQKQMQIWRAAAEKQREVLEYQKMSRANIPLPPEQSFGKFLRHLPIIGNILKEGDKQEKTGFGALVKWLPIIGGALGIIGLLKQSKIMSSFLEGFLSVIGALVDILLMPFVPLLTTALKGFAGLIPAARKFSEEISNIMKADGVWAGIVEIIKRAFANFVEFWKTDFWPRIKEAFPDFASQMEGLGKVIQDMYEITQFIVSIIRPIEKLLSFKVPELNLGGGLTINKESVQSVGDSFLKTLINTIIGPVGTLLELKDVFRRESNIQVNTQITAGKDSLGNVEIQRVQTRVGGQELIEEFAGRP